MPEAVVTTQVTCPSCGTVHTLKILPSKGKDQRWACPNCKARHQTV